jgi:hypothetical protein
MTFPVQSKGVFADAYKKVKQGKSPGSRAHPKVGVSGNSGVTYARIIPASRKLTAIGMRKPFG